MQTASVPRSAWQVSMRSSPKKCDFPEPRPPCTPLQRPGRSSGSNAFAVGIFKMDNDTLDSVDQLERAFVGGLERLRGLAPAAIEDRIGRGETRGMGCVLGAHDADQDVDRRSRVAARQRTEFGDGSGHNFLNQSGWTCSHGAVSVWPAPRSCLAGASPAGSLGTAERNAI